MAESSPGVKRTRPCRTHGAGIREEIFYVVGNPIDGFELSVDTFKSREHEG